MSGHSKWANIRVRKGAQDAKRNKVYTKHARLIEMAARAGADPKTNSSLRVAIENAKVDSVPNDNIERAIKKGSGELKGEAMQEAMYAAYAPGGVACLIECLTDNRNRTTANVKGIVGSHGGNFAETASVQWMFERKGVVIASLDYARDDSLELQLIDNGAEDFSMEDGIIRVVTSVNDWKKARDFLKGKGAEILSAGLSYVPTQKATIDEPAMDRLQKFIEAVEEDDDVSEVHTNAEM